MDHSSWHRGVSPETGSPPSCSTPLVPFYAQSWRRMRDAPPRRPPFLPQVRGDPVVPLVPVLSFFCGSLGRERRHLLFHQPHPASVPRRARVVQRVEPVVLPSQPLPPDPPRPASSRRSTAPLRPAPRFSSHDATSAGVYFPECSPLNACSAISGITGGAAGGAAMGRRVFPRTRRPDRAQQPRAPRPAGRLDRSAARA